MTIDTLRADAVGAWGGAAPTPHLDHLAEHGLRYARAVTVAPLTLPAHASLLTGRLPEAHGVVDNGVAVLSPGIPTLAERLGAAGWATGAVVGSRILDRRFGLDRGFDRYDDLMVAERVGEYGYPERPAEEVVDRALGWLEGRSGPVFLWVHLYDPHAPYEPGPDWPRRRTSRDRYEGEVAAVDRQLGRLLAAVDPERTLVVVVGDHGEMLGAHGERTHGLFLYRGSLDVPLLLAGPGVPSGRVVTETVATRRLAATVLELLGVDRGGVPGPILPGLGRTVEPRPVESETRFPTSAYGWSSLRAVTDGRWRYVEAPRPELYDLRADPDEMRNLAPDRPTEVERLAALLEPRSGVGAATAQDPEALAVARSLGYLSGSTGRLRSGLDPKDGVRLLGRFEEARSLLARGDVEGGLGMLRGLVRESPGNVPFLVRLAGAELAAGNRSTAITAYREAIELNPGLDFLHLDLGTALRTLGRIDEAREAFRRALEINPRFAPAWVQLAELADGEDEQAILQDAVSAGAGSLVLLVRLAQRDEAAGRPASADRRFESAVDLAPGWAPLWSAWADLRAARGDLPGALERARRAVGLAPGEARFQHALADLLSETGEEP